MTPSARRKTGVNPALQAWYRMAGHYPVTLNGMAFRGDPAHIPYWRKVNSGQWEPETFRLLAGALTPESVYCDIGSWIGPTVLCAARLCKRVYAFEPDPFAYEPLLANIRLNGLCNVIPFNLALADRDGMCKMGSAFKKLGNSTTSILHTTHSRLLDVPCMTWKSWNALANPGNVDFIKMDIEGGEFDLLPTMREYLAEHKPTVFLSTHAPHLPEPARAPALRRIIETMRVYGQCRDEKMQPVPIDDLAAPAVANAMRSFLFTA